MLLEYIVSFCMETGDSEIGDMHEPVKEYLLSWVLFRRKWLFSSGAYESNVDYHVVL